MAAPNREFRLSFLVRGLNAKESLFFPLVITVDEDQSALFSATIVGLEDKVISVGPSEDEAAEEAVKLFMDIVDTAVEQNLPLSQVLGDTSFRRAKISVSKAFAMFQALEELLDNETQKTDDWTKLNATPGFIPFMAAQAV